MMRKRRLLQYFADPSRDRKGADLSCARNNRFLTGAARFRLRGYLLLEVVVSVALLVVGLATIGMQISNSSETARNSHRMLRAMHLAESKMIEVDLRLVPDLESAVEGEIEGEFGRLFPEFGWRLRIHLTQVPDLWLVELDVIHCGRFNPDEEYPFDEAQHLYTIRALRATPARVDPARDFGADEESMESFAEALSGTGLDPNDLDIGALGSLPIEQLISLAQAFRDAGLLEDMDLSSILPPDVMQMLLDEIGDLTGGAEGEGEGEGEGGGGGGRGEGGR
jgi:type II secretory pathway pseudopilin PulG